MAREINLSAITGNNQSINLSTDNINENISKNESKELSMDDITNIVGAKEKVEYKDVQDVLLDKAKDKFEETLERKRREYMEYMEKIQAQDLENRLAIAEGLEEAPDPSEEIKYLNNDEDTEDDKKPTMSFEDELEAELDDMEKTAEVYASMKTTTPKIMNQNDIFDKAENKIPEYTEGSIEPSTITEKDVQEDPKEDSNTTEDLPIVDGSLENSDEMVSLLDIDNKVVIKPDLNKITKDSLELDKKDFEDLYDDEDDYIEDDNNKEKDDEYETIRKAAEKSFKAEILNKIVKTASNMDVSTFKVSKKSANLQSVLNKFKSREGAENTQSTATWALMCSGRPYTCTALTGPEVSLLNSNDDGQNSLYNIGRAELSILYRHDANPYKPATVEAWAKTISYADIGEIYMAEYVATYNKANYMPFECTNKSCMHMELQDIKDIMGKMVKFTNDEAKAKFDKIVSEPLTAENSIGYETVIVPINEYIAVGFKMPSLYTYFIEYRSIDQDFIKKYMDMLSVILYMDEIYLIDNGEFRVVDYKKYPDNIAKTFKSKIVTYSKILKSLTTNEFNIMVAYVRSMADNTRYISYVLPETKCSKCGYVIKEQQYNAAELVFTQLRLVAIATTSPELTF